MWGKRVRKCRLFFFQNVFEPIGLSVKTSRHKKGLTNLKNTVTTNQNHTIDLQNPKREHKHSTKENHQTTKGKAKGKRKVEETQNQWENKV